MVPSIFTLTKSRQIHVETSPFQWKDKILAFVPSIITLTSVSGLPGATFSYQKKSGYIWKVLEWKMFAYLTVIWLILWPLCIFYGNFGTFCGHLVFFSHFGKLCRE
jgi:hypothetical protein